MKAILEISPVALDPGKCTLVFELSDEGFSYVIKNDEENIYVAAAVLQTDKSDGTDDYSVILQNELQRQSILSENFKKVGIMHSLGESVLIPYSLYDRGENINALDLIHGDFQNNDIVLTDIIAEKELYNCYRVPTAVTKVVQAKFPGAVNIHQYSVLLKQVPAAGDGLSVIFYRKKIVLVLVREGILQLLNSFSYNTSSDVLYILMNACRQFGVDNIPVTISGLLDKNSSLAKEVHQYFTAVNFSALPEGAAYTEAFSQHPSHYISHIFAVDSCV
ncbi:MAG: DUF3822 family protein [Ginsengibacter sp.]